MLKRILKQTNASWKNLQITPMINLSSVTTNPNVTILGKCEFMNPTGSIKDRMFQNIFQKAINQNRLRPGMTIVAASSGNTASAVAMFAKIHGYKAILITNTKCSKEKIDSIKAYGGEVIITKSGVPIDSPDHYQNVEKKMVDDNPDLYFGVNQYDNVDNADTYHKYFGPEIYNQLNGSIDYFVAAASTGGTISGTGRYLKEHDPTIKVVLGDPEGSIFGPYCETGEIRPVGKFLVEGVGKDSIPNNFDKRVIDEVIYFKDQDAFSMCHQLAKTEGVMVGGSSGANVWVCKQIADKLPEYDGKNYIIVTPLVDSGVRYLSKIFNEQYLLENNIEINGV